MLTGHHIEQFTYNESWHLPWLHTTVWHSRCSIFSDVSSFLGWVIWFLNVVPQSSWLWLSLGQVLFWMQLRLNIWQHWGLHRRTENKQLHKNREVCPWCIKEEWGALLAGSDVQTSDVTLWSWPPGCWVWSAQQWRSVTHSQGSSLTPSSSARLKNLTPKPEISCTNLFHATTLMMGLHLTLMTLFIYLIFQPQFGQKGWVCEKRNTAVHFTAW